MKRILLILLFPTGCLFAGDVYAHAHAFVETEAHQLSASSYAYADSDSDSDAVLKPENRIGQKNDTRPLAIIRRFSPDVLVRTTRDEDWKAAQTAQSLFPADSLITAESGFAMVQFMDNSIVRLRPNSLLVIDGEVEGPESMVSRLSLEAGEIFTTITGRQSDIEVSTSSTVAAVRGTEFVTRVDENGKTTITGFSGEVVVQPRNSDLSYSIGLGNRLEVEEDGFTVTESEVTEDELNRLRNSFDPDYEAYREVEFRFVNEDGEVETIMIRLRVK